MAQGSDRCKERTGNGPICLMCFLTTLVQGLEFYPVALTYLPRGNVQPSVQAFSLKQGDNETNCLTTLPLDSPKEPANPPNLGRGQTLPYPLSAQTP